MRRSGIKVRKDSVEDNKELNRGKGIQIIRKVPRTAIVTLIRKGKMGDNAELLIKKAKEKVSLRKIGIERSKIRIATNGGIIIEIPGNDGNKFADKLTKKLKETMSDIAIIRRLVKMAEMIMRGIDGFVTKEEIKITITQHGDCKEDEIKIGEIKTMYKGLGQVWIQGPLVTAIKVCK